MNIKKVRYGRIYMLRMYLYGSSQPYWLVWLFGLVQTSLLSLTGSNAKQGLYHS